MADTPTSLLSKAWGAVISLLGIVVTLAFMVSIICCMLSMLVIIGGNCSSICGIRPFISFIFETIRSI